jgi:thiol-disulfide isomerase/thioredoxin
VTFDYVLNAPESAPSLSSMKGHTVLLDFWATWCGPCQQTAPVVDRIAARYRDQGLDVVGVNTSDAAGNAAPWAARHHLGYPIAYDEGAAARAYGVENLPTLVIIGKDGTVVAVHHGVTSDAELDELVKKAL